MKRNALALASLLALFTGAAQAQSSVTLYGLVDTGVEYINNIGTADDDVFRMPTIAGSFASRWGMRGSEDLGGGLKANFVLESGFGTDSGVPQQGGRIFGRQLYVGLSDSWGAVTLGRQYSQLLWVQIKTDPFLASVYGDGAFDLFLAAPRVDNSIAYNGKFGGLGFGALYSLGRDGGTCPGEAPGDTDNCSSWSADVFYEGTNWLIGGWYDEQNNALGQGDRRMSINGYYTIGTTKLSANFLDRKNVADVESTLWSVGVIQPVTAAVTLEAAYYDLNIKDSDDDSGMLVARANYAFSKRTVTYLYLAHMMNDGDARLTASIGQLPLTGGNDVRPEAGGNQTAVMLGLRHSF